MSIVANNSQRFNMAMDFWQFCDYTAADLMKSWKKIVDVAKSDVGEDSRNFLLDCMDVLYKKVMTLSDSDRNTLLTIAGKDMDAYERRSKLGVA